MSDEQILNRPIGWWLKEADSRLDAAFDAALSGRGVDRRRWQVLASLSRSSTPLSDLTTALASFDQPSVIEQAVDDLRRQGWIDLASDGSLQLTDEGRSQHAELLRLVDGIRAQVAAALPGDDYAALVRLLARLVAAFPP